jgi:hypothetical protein
VGASLREQDDDHGEPAARGVLRTQRPAHGLDEPLGDRQSEADPARAVTVPQALEQLERRVGRALGQSLTVVDDPRFDLLLVPARRSASGVMSTSSSCSARRTTSSGTVSC